MVELQPRPEDGPATDTELVIGPFTLDLGAGQLLRDAKLVPLRPKTFHLLAYLAERPGILISIDTLLRALWPGVRVSTKTLNNAISELRLALGDSATPPKFIETTHRRGYRFVGRVEVRKRERASSETANAARDACFVGRSTELDDLRLYTQRAVAGERQLVFVTGEPGIGKSMLVSTLLKEVESSAACVGIARGMCREAVESRESYGPLLDALEHLLSCQPKDELTRLVESCAPSWAALLPHRCAPPSAGDLRSMTAAGMLREGTGLFEQIASEQALILVLEDLHWADCATIDFLAALAHRQLPARLLVLATARLHEPGGESVVALIQALRQKRLARHLPVRPFTASEQRQYLTTHLGPETAEDLAPHFDRLCGGNPLFLSLAVEHFLERRRRGLASASEDARSVFDELPGDLRDLIERRLTACTAAQIELLEAASVCGAEFSTSLVGPLLEASADDVERTCRELASGSSWLDRVERLPNTSGAPGDQYIFRHVLYQQVLYARILPTRRAALHLQVGSLLERGYGTSASESPGELARHFALGGDAHRAARYSELAAEAEIRRFSYKEAARHLEESLSRVRRLPPSKANREWEARLLLAISGPLLAQPTSDVARARESSAEARKLYERLRQPRNVFRSTMALVVAHQMASRLDEARRWGEELVTLAERKMPSLRAQAYTYHAVSEILGGEFGAARRRLELAAELEAEPGIPAILDLRALAYSQLGVVSAIMGEPDLSRAWCQRASKRARTTGNLLDRVNSLSFEAIAAVACGDTEVVATVLRELERIERSHDVPPMGRAVLTLGAAVRARDDRNSLREFRNALRSEQLCTFPYRGQFLAMLAECELAHGEVDGARTAAEQGLEFEARSGARWYRAELLRLQAECVAATAVSDGSEAAARRCGRAGADGLQRAQALLSSAIDVARRQGAFLFERRAAAARERITPALTQRSEGMR